MKWAPLIFLLLLALPGCTGTPPPTASPHPTVSPMVEGVAPADSNPQLLEFVGRLFTFAGEEPLIMIGTVPDGLDVPLPPGATIVGSVTDPAENGGIIVLEVPGPPAQAVSSIAEELEAAGWEQGFRGFEPESSQVSSSAFCKRDSGQSLLVTAQDRGKELADVRLNLYAGQRCPISAVSEPPGPATLIPRLRPPGGSDQMPVTQGSGGGTGLARPGHAELGSLVRTTMTADSLEAHYRQQLLEQDWELLSTGAEDVAAWSLWRLTDEKGQEWAASLVVSNVGDEEDFRMAWVQMLQVDWESERPVAPPFP